MENILIVGAHPDDIELGCIGSLMKLKKEGKKIVYFIAFSENMTDYEEYKKAGFSIAPAFYHYADVVLPGYDKGTGIKLYMETYGIHHWGYSWKFSFFVFLVNKFKKLFFN